MKHLIDLNDMTYNDADLFTLAAKLKKQLKAGIAHPLLKETLAMIFKVIHQNQGVF